MNSPARANSLSGFLVPTTGFANVEDLIVANNGEVFLAGWYQGGALAGGPPAQGYDGFLMRTSPSGTPVWVNRLTGPGDDFFSGIATTPSPNEIVGGAFYFYQAAFAGTNLSLASGTNSAWCGWTPWAPCSKCSNPSCSEG